MAPCIVVPYDIRVTQVPKKTKKSTNALWKPCKEMGAKIHEANGKADG
jgi:hypothetical protein